MSQQDTGLGWSAENEYLTQIADTVITTLSGLWGDPSVYVGQPLPSGATDYNDPAIRTSGFLAATGRNNRWGENGAFRFMTATNTNTYCFRVGTIVYIAVADNTYVYYNVYNSDTMHLYTGTHVSLTFDTATGLYYGGPTVNNFNSYFPDDQIFNVPEYASIADALATFSILNDAFTKSEAGYSIACVAKWLTQNGTELNSPILISSNTTFADMSAAASYYFAKTSALLSGVRFYMGFYQNVPLAELPSAFPTVDLTDRGNLSLEQLLMTIISTSYAHVIIINSPDPYENEGGGSEEEGGDGSETEDDEHGIEGGDDFPSAINTGFCRIFTPSESDLQALSSYLWSSSYDLTQVKKLFSNPMDSIIGLSAVPIRLSGSSVSFSLGGVPITGLTLPLVSKQRYSYFMGNITVKERWGSYLDYEPYTKFSIFLPFIGMRELSTDDIMGKTIGLHYDFDILSGTCVARLQAEKLCLYEWGGTCALQLPINSRNWDSVFNTAVGAVTGIVSAAASGGAPLVAGSVASAALQTVSMKPRIDKSGSINGAAGWLGQMRPYLIRTTPEAYVATDQNTYIGYPSYMSISLGSLTGYNEIESVHLENIPATGDELAELESILKGGVIF